MNIQNHPVVSREEWLAARKQHLAHEKAFTKERDKLSAERRALPWVKIDKDYRFQGPNGELKLATCSAAVASWSSTTSCLAKAGTKAAPAARSCPITSTAPTSTWPIMTSPW